MEERYPLYDATKQRHRKKRKNQLEDILPGCYFSDILPTRFHLLTATQIINSPTDCMYVKQMHRIECLFPYGKIVALCRLINPGSDAVLRMQHWSSAPGRLATQQWLSPGHLVWVQVHTAHGQALSLTPQSTCS